MYPAVRHKRNVHLQARITFAVARSGIVGNYHHLRQLHWPTITKGNSSEQCVVATVAACLWLLLEWLSLSSVSHPTDAVTITEGKRHQV